MDNAKDYDGDSKPVVKVTESRGCWKAVQVITGRISLLSCRVESGSE